MTLLGASATFSIFSKWIIYARRRNVILSHFQETSLFLLVISIMNFEKNVRTDVET